MTQVATREDKLGALLKYEEAPEHGFCRKVLSVTLSPTSEIGDVMYDNSGNYALVDVANTANAAAILIDRDVYTNRPSTGTSNVNTVCLVRGSAIVADDMLNYASDVNTANEKAAVNAVIEALDILVREQV